MKIVVVSDSHGNSDILYKILEDNSDADLFIHAGDSGLNTAIYPYRMVRGNCDYYTDFPSELNINTPYGKIYVTHGHQYMTITEYSIKSKDCKIFIFGHTHKHLVKEFDDTYLCNPGSVSLPRDGTDGTYLIINIDHNNCEFVFKYL